MKEKSLKDISWNVPEEEYREDSALSYSTLATYERGGFNVLNSLYERKETPSLTFGSAVDAIITGGEEEFNSRFIVAEFPDIPDNIVKIVKKAFELYGASYRTLSDVSDLGLLNIITEYNYQSNWKPETRVKVVKEKGSDYYDLLFLAEDKTILSSDTYAEVIAAVRALKESPATEYFFRDDDPFNDNIERCYQLKFKATLNGVDYRCMADLLLVDYDRRVIYPKDLKTSSHYEWEFYKSFIDWNYQIQARLYWRIIRDNLDRDSYFKNFYLADYEFIVVNKSSLMPLTWIFPETQKSGPIIVGKASSPIELRDPETIGKELKTYLDSHPTVPMGISIEEPNNLMEWLCK